jgi:hypothetical protein
MGKADVNGEANERSATRDSTGVVVAARTEQEQCATAEVQVKLKIFYPAAGQKGRAPWEILVRGSWKSSILWTS